MGEYADYAIDCMFEMENLRQNYRFGFIGDDDAYDLGILDEHGAEISPKIIKPSGPGRCPKCGANTTLRNGKNGKFYGCTNFPKCKGNRNYE